MISSPKLACQLVDKYFAYVTNLHDALPSVLQVKFDNLKTHTDTDDLKTRAKNVITHGLKY